MGFDLSIKNHQQRRRSNQDDEPGPSGPIDARVGGAKEAGSFGYHTPFKALDGTIESAMDATGRRVSFVNGKPPEQTRARAVPVRDGVGPSSASVALAQAPNVAARFSKPLPGGAAPPTEAATPAANSTATSLGTGATAPSATSFPAAPPLAPEAIDALREAARHDAVTPSSQPPGVGPRKAATPTGYGKVWQSSPSPYPSLPAGQSGSVSLPNGGYATADAPSGPVPTGNDTGISRVDENGQRINVVRFNGQLTDVPAAASSTPSASIARPAESAGSPLGYQPGVAGSLGSAFTPPTSPSYNPAFGPPRLQPGTPDNTNYVPPAGAATTTTAGQRAAYNVKQGISGVGNALGRVVNAVGDGLSTANKAVGDFASAFAPAGAAQYAPEGNFDATPAARTAITQATTPTVQPTQKDVPRVDLGSGTSIVSSSTASPALDPRAIPLVDAAIARDNPPMPKLPDFSASRPAATGMLQATAPNSFALPKLPGPLSGSDGGAASSKPFSDPTKLSLQNTAQPKMPSFATAAPTPDPDEEAKKRLAGG